MEKLIVIIGQTSSGKSDLAVALAKRFDGEIVSADSRQVYRGLDYSSGKIAAEEMQGVPHHLLDVATLGKQYTLYDFQRDAYKIIDEIVKKNKVPFLVGGTGLWTRAVVQGYNLKPDAPNETLRRKFQGKSIEELIKICESRGIVLKLDAEYTARRLIRLIEKNGEPSKNEPRYQVLQIGLRWKRETIYSRIKSRLERRLPYILREIENLLASGVDKNFLIGLGLEAKEVTRYLCGEFASYEEFFEELFKKERHFAKRQDTWYKREEQVVWIDAEGKSFPEIAAEAEKIVLKFLQSKEE